MSPSLVAYSHKQVEVLWDSVLCVPVDSEADTGEWLYQIIARGPWLPALKNTYRLLAKIPGIWYRVIMYCFTTYIRCIQSFVDTKGLAHEKSDHELHRQGHA